MEARFTVYPPAGSSIFDLLSWQGRPITYNGAVVGRADKVDIKTDGRVIITADVNEVHARRRLATDFALLDQ